MSLVPEKFKKETNYNDVVDFLVSKNFSEKDFYVSDDSKSKFGAYSYTRLTHKTMKKSKGKDFEPELVMYFDSLDETGYVFSFSVDLGLGPNAYIPFFGDYSRIVRRGKNLHKVNNSLISLFGDFQKFIEFVNLLKRTKVTPRKRTRLMRKLLSARFNKKFLTAGTSVDISKLDVSQYMAHADKFNGAGTYWDVLRMIYVSLFTNDYFVMADFVQEDRKGHEKTGTLRKPVTNQHRLYELKKELFSNLQEDLFGIDEEDDEFIEFSL